ncbi:DUF5701 family protein [Oerskovia flava]|uniref:DUF5701 family protein n=1 Tax=Oerskovia flava TaxID=2986422 RepID=UPI0022404589|nr:DUF5701 family protein [Oerskovia sp. JB1-3-2]
MSTSPHRTTSSTPGDQATPGRSAGRQQAPPLPPVRAQAERLIEIGVPELAGTDATTFRALAARLDGELDNTSRADDRPAPSALLAVHPTAAPPSALAPLLRRGDAPGFVVVDMPDVDRFSPIDGIDVPEGVLYVVTDPDRGDDLSNWSPNEALGELAGRRRTPLLLSEGIHWALQVPAIVARNHCYMTIGSRLRKPGGALDARTPAVWISNGTGRDGRERRGAPKVGWCWAGNRHTWLGFASATGRRGGTA